MARYCPLFSGSKGNCTFVGTADSGILVDAGVSAKRIKDALSARDIALQSLQGVCITHEHSDHIAGLRVLIKQLGLTVYASAGTLSALIDMQVITSGCNIVPLDTDGVTVGDFYITPFHTPHDARESMGYCIETPDERRVGIATDMGYMRPEVENILSQCDLVHIESNYDVGMLRSGFYPLVLQDRIASDRGHLSNSECAATVARLALQDVTRFTLAHVSENNNTPILAQRASTTALAQAGFAVGDDCFLHVASPVGQSAPIIF